MNPAGTTIIENFTGEINAASIHRSSGRMSKMKLLIAVIAVLALQGCGSVTIGPNDGRNDRIMFGKGYDPEKLTWRDLQTWKVDCLTKNSDMTILDKNVIKNPYRQDIKFWLLFDNDGSPKLDGRWNTQISHLLYIYQTECADVRRPY